MSKIQAHKIHVYHLAPNSPVDPVWRDPIGSLDIPPLPLALAAKSIAALSLLQLAHSPQNVHKISRKIHFITKNLKKKKKSQVKPVTEKWQWLAYPVLSLLSGEERFLPFYSPSSFFSM